MSLDPMTPDNQNSARGLTGTFAPVTAAGQVQKGDWLVFDNGGETKRAVAELILNAGTDREEVVYNKKKNHYFNTAMVIDGTSGHKNVTICKLEPPPLASRADAPPRGEAETGKCVDCGHGKYDHKWNSPPACSEFRPECAPASPPPVLPVAQAESARLYPGTEMKINAAVHALRSYQYGNSATDLAKVTADMLEEFVRETKAAPALSEGLTEAARDVLAERVRQKTAEGWTEAHDDEFKTSPLAVAAACYALDAACHSDIHISWKAEYNKVAEKLWPFDSEWWKPKDQRRNLVRAGAMIVAEIERLDRLSPAAPLAIPFPVEVQKNAYSIQRVLEVLAESADVLLNTYNYDSSVAGHHGSKQTPYEVIATCRDRAREIIPLLALGVPLEGEKV